LGKTLSVLLDLALLYEDFRMTTNAGVWVDHQHATVVFLNDPKRKLTNFVSESKEPIRAVAADRKQVAYTPNDFVPEDRGERKFVAQRNRLYDKVISVLEGVESVLILGPGEAKLEFQKRLHGKKLRTKVLKIEPTDKMTDRQLTAHVREFFKPKPAKKAVRKQSTTKKISVS
jgi:hypothetical protein